MSRTARLIMALTAALNNTNTDDNNTYWVMRMNNCLPKWELVTTAFISCYPLSRVFMTRSLNITPKTTEQHLIVRICKSEAKVTNSKRVRSRYCTVEANYWQTRSIARPLCDSRATCLDIGLSHARLETICAVPEYNVECYWKDSLKSTACGRQLIFL